MAQYIHHLVLGEIFRTREQIRFLAGKLIVRQVADSEKQKSIIDFLCADSGSHDYTINRREATELGLNIEKPSEAFYKVIGQIDGSWRTQLELDRPYLPQGVVSAAHAAPATPVQYTHIRALIEGTRGGSFGFVSEGNLTQTPIAGALGPQNAINDNRTFEGWRRLV
jgi:hypothetical protein